jgi:hypothetical protein
VLLFSRIGALGTVIIRKRADTVVDCVRNQFVDPR